VSKVGLDSTLESWVILRTAVPNSGSVELHHHKLFHNRLVLKQRNTKQTLKNKKLSYHRETVHRYQHDALCQLKSWPAVIQIMQTGRVLA